MREKTPPDRLEGTFYRDFGNFLQAVSNRLDLTEHLNTTTYL